VTQPTSISEFGHFNYLRNCLPPLARPTRCYYNIGYFGGFARYVGKKGLSKAEFSAQAEALQVLDRLTGEKIDHGT
jgi:hypothetical protein